MLQVFVLGSSKWVEGQNAARVFDSLREGLPHFRKVVVLMDPDVAGRQGRNILEAAFPGQFWHAFLPAHLATSVAPTRQDSHFLLHTTL
jgi:5S rRNA maturation endonuclease (ribonuclease M5)